VQYHGGGDAAIIEPIGQHLVEYDYYLALYFLLGVSPCVRGNRLYDPAVPQSLAIVQHWTGLNNRSMTMMRKKREKDIKKERKKERKKEKKKERKERKRKKLSRN
jgi:hypothetical protein